MSSDSDDPLLLQPSHRPRKRRRLNPKLVVLVESSDVGEMEELAALDHDYWNSPESSNQHEASGRLVGTESVRTVADDGLSAGGDERDAFELHSAWAADPGSSYSHFTHLSHIGGTQVLDEHGEAMAPSLLARLSASPRHSASPSPSAGNTDSSLLPELSHDPDRTSSVLSTPPISAFTLSADKPDQDNDLPQHELPPSSPSSPQSSMESQLPSPRRLLSPSASPILVLQHIEPVKHGVRAREASSPLSPVSDDDQAGGDHPLPGSPHSPSIPNDLLEDAFAPPGRVLRQRTTLQQQPYTMERFFYKNLLAKRGLKDAIVRDEALTDHGRGTDDGTDAWREGETQPTEESLSDPSLLVQHPPKPRPRPRPVRPPEPQSTSPPRRNKSAKPKPVGLDELLAPYGGLISDDEDDANLANRPCRKAAVTAHRKPPARIESSPPSSPQDSPSHSIRPESTQPARSSRSGWPTAPGNVIDLRSSPDLQDNSRSENPYALSDDEGEWPSNEANVQTRANPTNSLSPRRSSFRDSGSESDEAVPVSSSTKLSRRNRRAVKDLGRMGPAVWVQRLLDGEGTMRRAKQDRKRSAVAPRDNVSPSPVPSPPDLANDVVEFDYESRTEAEGLVRDDSAIIEISDDSQDSVSDSDSESEADPLDDLNGRPRSRSLSASPGPEMEWDRIDYMLSRSNFARRGQSSKKKRNTKSTAQAGSKVVHSRPRVKRTVQTKLNFPVERRSGSTNRRLKPSSSSRRGYKRGSLKDVHAIFGRRSASAIPAIPQPARPSRHFQPQERAVSLERSVSPAVNVGRPPRPAPVIPAGPFPKVAEGGQGQATSAESVPSDFDRFSDFSLDLNIDRLPPGTRFPPSTYIGKGRLYDLLAIIDSTAADIVPVHPFDGLGLHLGSEANSSDFEEKIPVICDVLHTGWHSNSRDSGADLEISNLMRHVNLFMSWFLPRQTVEVAEQLCETWERQLRHLLSRTSSVNPQPAHGLPSYCVQWFAIELSIRMDGCLRKFGYGERPQKRRMRETCSQLMSDLVDSLIQHGPHITMDAVNKMVATPDETFDDWTSQLWVCLMHVARAQNTRDPLYPGFLSYVEAALVKKHPQAGGLKVSEQIWYSIYCLCSLSHFSPTGGIVTASLSDTWWTLVLQALSHSSLASGDMDSKLSGVGMINRDRYVRLVLKRCALMVTRWGWDISSADTFNLFRVLNDLFRTRKYRNLSTRENRPDFATFLVERDIRNLSDLEADDTAYGIFLKLVARSVHGYRTLNEEKKASRLLSLVTPVGSVTFTREKPPTHSELSMFFNRVSGLMLSLYLEPAIALQRMKQLRHVLDFSGADDSSRGECIRAAMYLGILLRHLGLDLDFLTDWTNDIMKTLLAELSVHSERRPVNGESRSAKERTEELICLLLRSVGRVMEVRSLDPAIAARPAYPDVVLIDNSWAPSVLRSTTDIQSPLVSHVLRYIQAFLHERSLVIPRKPEAPIAPPVNEESQDYGDDEFDFEDPALIAALDSAEGRVVETYVDREKKLATIIDTTLSPAIFQFLSNVFSPQSPLSGEQWSAADAAVDCWADCAYLLVSNGIRDWTSYIGTFGVESYHRFINSFERHRVGLRFIHKILLLDPTEYHRLQEDFLRVWCHSLVRPNITIEHECTAALIRHDGCGRGLLDGLNVNDYGKMCGSVDAMGFAAIRIELIDAVFRNARVVLIGATSDDPAAQKDLRVVRSAISALVSALKLSHEMFTGDQTLQRREYRQFCRKVAQKLVTVLPEFIKAGEIVWLSE